MPIVKASIGEVAMIASLGAATLIMPGIVGTQQYTTKQNSIPYSNILYTTKFKDYNQSAVSTSNDFERIRIINDVVRKMTKDSIPLTERQHAILNDNLFDFL